MDKREQPIGEINVLLIEDDEMDFALIKRMVAKAPQARFKLDWCASYEEGKWRMTLDQHDVYLVDNRLDEASGLDLIKEMLDKGVAKPMILLTGLDDRSLDQEAIALGAANYLPKSELSPTLLERAIRHAIEQRRAARALHESEAKLSAIINNTAALICLKDWEGRYLMVNRQFEQVHGLEPGAAIGKTDDQLFPDDLADVRISQDRAILQTGRRLDSEEVIETAEGARIYLTKRFPICNEQGLAVSVGCIAADITDRKTLEDQLRSLSLKDGLTGLANRRFFDETLAREWARMKRAKKPLAIVMVDIDHFKQYNDHYGHHQGDECLKRTAAVLQSVFLRPGDFAARYGGEEFALVLPNTDAAGAVRVAERVQAGMESLGLAHETSPVAPRVTLSLGVASMTPAADAGETELLERADQALYQAKDTGRNSVRLFEPGAA